MYEAVIKKNDDGTIRQFREKRSLSTVTKSSLTNYSEHDTVTNPVPKAEPEAEKPLTSVPVPRKRKKKSLPPKAPQSEAEAPKTEPVSDKQTDAEIAEETDASRKFLPLQKPATPEGKNHRSRKRNRSKTATLSSKINSPGQ